MVSLRELKPHEKEVLLVRFWIFLKAGDDEENEIEMESEREREREREGGKKKYKTFC